METPIVVDIDKAVADYVAARAAIATARQAQHDAEAARKGWLKAKRGVPPHKLYDAKNGAPLSPELAALEQAVTDAVADVRWCQAVTVACGELVKGEGFDEVVARNARAGSPSRRVAA